MVETLILHAGTPKTGSTSLQLFLHQEREKLIRRGVLYPSIDETAEPSKPKHQWMVNELLKPDGGQFVQKVQRALAQAEPTTHTMILSTEGLFNHWWDFSTAGQDALRSLTKSMSVQIWVWYREPVSFIRANYIQMLRNPRWIVACYGRDLSVEEMLDDLWFSKHLDYIGFLRQAEEILGRGSVVPFAYNGDTIDSFLRALNLTDLKSAHLTEHRTLGELGARLLRLINQYDLSGEEKRVAVDHISKLDALAGQQSQPLAIAAATADRIRHLAAASITALERDFGLSFASSTSENAYSTHER
jgi:hypothetical protein